MNEPRRLVLKIQCGRIASPIPGKTVDDIRTLSFEKLASSTARLCRTLLIRNALQFLAPLGGCSRFNDAQAECLVSSPSSVVVNCSAISAQSDSSPNELHKRLDDKMGSSYGKKTVLATLKRQQESINDDGVEEEFDAVQQPLSLKRKRDDELQGVEDDDGYERDETDKIGGVSAKRKSPISSQGAARIILDGRRSSCDGRLMMNSPSGMASLHQPIGTLVFH